MSRDGADAIVSLHASVAVVGEAGVLVRGASGSGKTRLVLALVAEARREGFFARVVADDRTLVAAHGGRLVARPHPALAGLVERRGIGLSSVPSEPACVLGLVVDLLSDGWPSRMPEPHETQVSIGGIALDRIAIAAMAPATEAVALVLAVLASQTAKH